MITLDLPPQTEQILTAQAQTAGLSLEKYLLNHIEQLTKPSYIKGDFDFDLQRIKQAIGDTDSNGRAKNIAAVPNWALTDLASFDKWLAV